MSTSPTTPKALRLAYVDLIRGITPTHPERQDHLWAEAPETIRDVRGLDLRTFQILTGPAIPDGEGMYGGEDVECVMEMRIRVSYAGLQGNELTDMITRDGLDLWAAFHSKPGGSANTIAGLISHGSVFVTPEPANEEEEQHLQTNMVVDFVLEVHFFAQI